jgi:NADH-quinone oxidoreductase subunit H
VGIIVIAALTTVLFLGGWHGPFSDQLGWLWTLVKIVALSFVIIWFRVTLPRLREDQLQRICWLVLVPVALAQLVLTAAVKVIW